MVLCSSDCKTNTEGLPHVQSNRRFPSLLETLEKGFSFLLEGPGGAAPSHLPFSPLAMQVWSVVLTSHAIARQQPPYTRDGRAGRHEEPAFQMVLLSFSTPAVRCLHLQLKFGKKNFLIVSLMNYLTSWYLQPEVFFSDTVEFSLLLPLCTCQRGINIPFIVY